MAILDENTDFIDQNDVPFMSTALRYGLIGGGLITVLTLLSGALGLNESTSGGIIATVISLGIYIWIVYASIKQHRDEELGGYITMGRAFLTGLVPVLIAGVIGGLVGFIYYNYIDPAAIDTIVEASAEMMEGFGLNEEQMEEALQATREGFGFGKLMLNSVLGGGIMGAIISGITGAIMKKEPPMVA